MKKLIYGVGFNDGKYPTRVNGVVFQQYIKWNFMLIRCHDEKFKEKNYKYNECSIDDRFKSYSYFYEWYVANNIPMDATFQLDKDILVRGNKIYSPENCIIIPREINNTFLRREADRGPHPIGVSWYKGRFMSHIGISGKNVHLGYFDNEIDAFIAYKEAKEFRIKQLANKHKDSITPRAYSALMNYSVEITD